MKTNNQPPREFDTVAFFRSVKEKIAKELEGKSFEQQKEVMRKFLSGEQKLQME
ncbi:MAG: hypothetical protein HY960_00750 [Ignavibacteriae bacterium]|nr:hypothetical protein [Ignavibacteriota bacterium]